MIRALERVSSANGQNSHLHTGLIIAAEIPAQIKA